MVTINDPYDKTKQRMPAGAPNNARAGVPPGAPPPRPQVPPGPPGQPPTTPRAGVPPGAAPAAQAAPATPRTMFSGIQDGVRTFSDKAGAGLKRTGGAVASGTKAAVQGARNRLPTGVVKGGGTGLALGASAIQTAMTPTEDYYKRFGIQPKNDGTWLGDAIPNLGIRALGAASDIGDTLTFGVIGNRYFRDRNPDGGSSARVPQPAPVSAPSQDLPPGEQPSAAPNGAPIFRKGSQFSDQPIDGGELFQPTRGGFSAPAQQAGPTLTERYTRMAEGMKADREERLARQQQQIGNAIQVAKTAEARTATEAAARSLRNSAKSLVNDFSPRRKAEMLMKAADMEAGAAGIGATPVPGRTPEQELALSNARRQGALQDEQIADAQFGNRQRASQQQILDNLANIGALPSDQRGAAIDAALASQGKDPRAGQADRYMTFKDQTPTMFDKNGKPVAFGEIERFFDTQTGRPVDIGGGAAVGNPQGSKPSFDEFLKAAKADPRNRGLNTEQLTDYYLKTYGS